MIKLNFKKIIIEILIFHILFLPAHILAETNLFTSIGVRQEYNDNIFFTRNNTVGDSITSVIPALRLNHKTELLNLLASALWDSKFYWDNNDLNTTNQNYTLRANYQMTERWSVSGNAGYLKDTTLDSQLEETGIVGIRQNRERFDASAGTQYAVSETSTLGFDYDYEKINYEREASVDTDLHRLRIAYSRRLANQVDFFSIVPLLTYGTSDEWDAYNSALDFRITHQFNPTLRGSFGFGVRNTQINYKDARDDKNDWGGNLDVWIEKKSEVTVGRLSLNNNLQTFSDGEIVNVARLLLNIDQRITERFGAGFIGGLYYTRPIEETFREKGDTWYFTVGPSLFYRLTENHILRLVYSYDREISPELDIEDNIRQRIWMTLDFNFPHTWERFFS